jgi:DNA-binding CsgD family transcriptional regulator
MDEPQFTGVLGALQAELDRREGDLSGARSAVEGALERLKESSDDATRLARVRAAGMSVEADAAQRARDLGDREDEQDALARADAHLAGAEAAAADNGPLERAWLLEASAEHARANGAADARAYAAAAEAWSVLERPYPSAVMRFREAEALAQTDARGAAAVAFDAYTAALRMGAGWLRGELERLAGRARLPLPERDAAPESEPEEPGAEDPYGLTARERQVLALVARGATNREIGGELFMAEKTASVHVSRILAKLNVRSRTEAAGVAHRLRLVD